MTEPIQSPREKVLRLAIDATCSDRNRSYGDPVVQLGYAGHLKDDFRAMHDGEGQRLIGTGEWEALDMILTKLSRLVIGPAPGRDTYIDIAAYAAIAWECALAAQRLEEEADDD